MAPLLSILTFTRCEPHAPRFLTHLTEVAQCMGAELVVCVDTFNREPDNEMVLRHARPDVCAEVKSSGYVESVLDEGIALCSGAYVLRMDDDETCSKAMVDWLFAEEFRAHDHWQFSTANLWRDERSVPVNHPLWPDPHTRLSTKAKSGGRRVPHAMSPYGMGELAPVIHLHHKFLVKSLERRQALADHYASMGSLIPWATLPEQAFESLTLAPLGDGTLRLWRAEELEVVEIGAPA